MTDSRLPVTSHAASSSSPSSSCLARQVDAFAVYEEAVQTPAIECSNLASLYYNAQPIGSPRPDAKILREDFSSTAAVAVHWLSLHAGNRSQAVDIDLEALKIARRRLVQGQRPPVGGGRWKCRLLQHADLNKDGQGSRWLDEETESNAARQRGAVDNDDATPSDGLGGGSEEPAFEQDTTWAKGAATDRFERKYQARLAREREKAKKKDKAKRASSSRKEKDRGTERGGSSSSNDATPAFSGNLDKTVEEEEAPHLTLLHSSVLSLPVPAPPPALGTKDSRPCPPDIVASLNYALSYFHRRADLVAYLTSVRKSLRPGTGVLICDQFAGPLGEAARRGYGKGEELSAEEEEKEQDELWQRFAQAPGFLRQGETPNDLPSRLDATNAGVQVWKPAGADNEDERQKVHSQDGANAAVWPRGRLSLVRTGTVPHAVRDPVTGKTTGNRDVAFEYWREDTPVDLVTNRFRMSLSFRFVEDGSFVRDFFSYDFRFWTLAEVLEAMDEAGFAEVMTEVLDRGAADDDEAEGARKNGEPEEDRHSQLSLSDDENDEAGDGGLGFLRRTEKDASRPTASYCKVSPEEDKVFARRSFGTYVVARAPP